MQQTTKKQIFKLLAPLLLALGFIVKIFYSIVFGWWLDPLLQWRGNRELVNEVKLKWGSLLSPASAIIPVRSDWPTIKIVQGNLLFTVVRWHDETAIRIAPRHAPTESYELGPLVAAIEHRHYSERDIVNDLTDAEKVLRSRLETLDAAFSEQEYHRIREKL